MDQPDEVLWAAACRGDEEAFAVVFRRHCDAVQTQCARRAGSYDVADDLLATVFMQAWRSRGRVRFVDGSLRPWLMVVANNVVATHMRSRRRREAMTRRLTTTAAREQPETDADPAARLEALTFAPVLAAALSTLSPREQAVVALCDLAEYPQAAAAKALDVPLGTVKSRLSRAHQKLRDRLGDEASAALHLETAGSPLQEVR